LTEQTIYYRSIIQIEVLARRSLWLLW